MSIELSQTTFAPPFSGPAKNNRGKSRNFRGLRSAGIYIIKENDVIVYVGMSQSCVIEALYRHFYPWKNDPTRRTQFPRVTYAGSLDDNKYEVCVMKCGTEDAPKIERGLILSIEPRDNRERYDCYLAEIIRKQGPADEPDPDSFPVDTGADLPF